MPAIPMYLNETDLEVLRRWLNENKELAFLLPQHGKYWIAEETIDKLSDKTRYAIWHIVSVLRVYQKNGAISIIQDPWKGWHDEVSNGATPYLGPGCPSVIFLDINIRDFNLEGNKKINALGMSHFEWIGDHYKSIGLPASKETHMLWKRMQTFVKKNSVKIPRSEDSSEAEIFAFPGALEFINKGMPRCDSP